MSQQRDMTCSGLDDIQLKTAERAENTFFHAPCVCVCVALGKKASDIIVTRFMLKLQKTPSLCLCLTHRFQKQHVKHR